MTRQITITEDIPSKNINVTAPTAPTVVTVDSQRGPKGDKGDTGTIAVGDVDEVNPDQSPAVVNSGTNTDAIFDFELPRAPTIDIGNVVTNAPSSPATITDTGTNGDVVLNFGIPQGVQGSQGPQGPQGAAATIAVGTTSTLAPSSPATVANTGTTAAAVFDFGIPEGVQGPQGAAATIAVGATSTLAPSSSATVTNSGTSGAAVFDFGIPEGVQGSQGPQGTQGPQGPQGAAATIAVGTTSTLSPGASATVANSGTSGAAVFDFGVPEGVQGAQGPQGDEGIEISATEPVNTDILWADISDPGYQVIPVGGATGDVLSKQSGADFNIEWASRTTLASDAAFTSKYVEQPVAPKVGDLLVVQSLSPLVLEPVDALQIAMLNTDLVLLVDTTAPSATTTVTLPLAGTVDVYVDWGDGLSNVYTTSGNKTHTYASAGQYRVRVEGSLTAFGANVSRPELIGCASFGRLGITDLGDGFRASANVLQVPSRIPITVTSLRSTLRGLTAFNQNISGWNTINVTNFEGLFFDSPAFNQNISGWDTSNVTTMFETFRNATAFNQDIGGWDTSNVTNMRGLFRSATAFNQNIGGWDTSSVTDFSTLFTSATAFNQNISGWDTSSATNLQGTFFGATAFNQDIGGWDTSNVTNFDETFRNATAFNQDIGGWDVRKATIMSSMLRVATAFEQNIGPWRPQRCTTFLNFLLSVTLNAANYDALLTGWTDFDGTGWDTGSITAFADAGGGQVTVTTSAAHGLPNGHVMRISGTTNYDGYYVISNVAATTFRITAAFVATETGTWQATLMANCTFTGGNSKYNPAGLVGRDILTNAPFNWTITDGGPV